MSTININGARIWYEESGSGPHSIVFSHGLLMNHRMFDAQVKALSRHYRCIAYDHRGQGRSEITPNGYDMDTLAEDAAALIEALDCAPCHFLGLSMGGFVALRLAIRRPELLRSLILMETTADPEPADSKRRYRLQVMLARWLGFRPLAGALMPIMFGNTFLQDPARGGDRDFWRQVMIDNKRSGTLRAAQGVIRREGVHEQLNRIHKPTLILVGDEDAATPVPQAQRMHSGIRDSKLVVIPGAGHSSTIENPDAVTGAVATFLRKLDPAQYSTKAQI